MATRGADRRRSNGGRERSAYTRLKKQNVEPMEIEYVAVPRHLKGRVIGKGGCVIKEIIKSSGASISSGKDDEWFTVSGKVEQRAYAKKLILGKVQEIQRRMEEGAPPGELVDVPSKYKGLVMGTGGDNLRKISTQTGAKVTRKDGEVYIVSGTEDQRQQAKMNINMMIASARLRGVENEFNKVRRYIDGWNLPEDCYLKLEQAVNEDRMVLPGTYHYVQYRLKPAEDYGPQDCCCSTHDPSYMPKLINDALESLRKIKDEMTTNEYLKLDMWCHFGTAIIRGPDEEEAAEQEWTIDEAAQRFQSSDEEDYWRTAFNQGVNLDEKILEGNAGKKTPEDFIARHDLTYLTPNGHQIRCKVWVARKNVEKQLEDAEVPFGDVKNILEEIHFENESTRKRCRGWLVLPSRRYLQADIFFPGCEFDCRLTIRGRTDSAFNTDYVPKEDERHALSRYLSELTLMDEHGFDICLPQMDIPNGFYLTHKRCSRRSLYEFNDGFAVILSRESTWRSDVAAEESRESTDLHLHCKEWDKLLRTGDWEPDIIAGKIPAFFKFVKSVQDFVLLEMRRTSEK